LSVFGCIETSESETSEKEKAHQEYLEKQRKIKESYQKYFEEQKEINKGIVKLNVPGARTLQIDGSFAEKVLKTCPNEIDMAISRIKQNIFRENEKNM
jgi:hypothetical protein